MGEVGEVGLGPRHPRPAGGGGRSGGRLGLLGLLAPQPAGGGGGRSQVEADLTVGSLEGRQSDLRLGQVDHGGGGGGLALALLTLLPDAVHAGVSGLLGQGVLEDQLSHSVVSGRRGLSCCLLPWPYVGDPVHLITPGPAQLSLRGGLG